MCRRDFMYIKREKYLQKIRPFYNVDLIKVLTGVLTALYSSKPPCLIFHRTALASIDD